MRIAIDARYITDHFPGIGRYTYNLIQALAKLDHNHTLIILYNPALPNTRYDIAALARYPSIKIVAVNERPFTLTEQRRIPMRLNGCQADRYHAPYYLRPYLHITCPSIVTLYDLIPHHFPKQVSLQARLLTDFLTRLAINTSQHILTLSTNTRTDLITTYNIPPEHITVTPLAADERFHPQPPATIANIRTKYALPERYILTLSSNKPHKNLPRLIEAWEQTLPSTQRTHHPTTTLVIAGHWDTRYPEAQHYVTKHHLEHHVRFLPNIAEADLPALYSGALAFAFPSRYEGFGLPPLEAMACGTPILCSNNSSLPEVVGNAALLIDPDNTTAISTGLAQLRDDSTLRARLRDAGLRQAATFSWQATAQTTLAIYEQR